MLGKILKRIFLLTIISAVGYGAYVALSEKPLLVDTSVVQSAAMKVTINEEGVTQVQDVYTVSATIAGHLDRTNLKEGDTVTKGQTIASIHPLDPPFLDQRILAELKASIEAVRASVVMANAEHQRAEAAMQLAKANYERAEKLVKRKIVSQSTADQALSDLQLTIAQVESALANIDLRKAELASAEARLVQPQSPPNPNKTDDCCIAIFSPIDGVVLSVIAESEQAVASGAKIAEIGDLTNIEVKVDLLTSDAVRITPGATVEISDWGGEEVLNATVRRIEPAAFTKVSALGIEEQRVNVILDLENFPKALGHGYRVLAHLSVWETEEALQVPISSLFRSDGSWAVFVIKSARAQLQKLTIGQMNTRNAQVLEGIAHGDAVILFPSDQLSDGRRVEIRNVEQN